MDGPEAVEVPPALRRAVRHGGARRLLVVAAAGYGKTTGLRAALRSTGAPEVRWSSLAGTAPDGVELAERVAAGAAGAAGGRVDWLVLDDLPGLRPAGTRRLVTAVERVGPQVRVALVSRWPLVPAWPGGDVAEVGPGDLAVPLERATALVAARYGLADPELARRLHELSAGWPALLHLAAAAVADGTARDGLAGPGSPLAAHVRERVLAPLPSDVGRLVRDVVGLAPVGAALCRALGHARAERCVDLLERTGVLVGGRRSALVPLVSRVAGGARSPEELRRRDRRAAAWFSEHGPPSAAALAHQRAGDDPACRRLLEEQGQRMLSHGDAATVVRLVGALPAADRGRDERLLLGDALRTVGELAGARREYEHLAAGVDPLPPALAWRSALLHHAEGAPRSSLALCDRTDPAAGSTLDGSWLLSTAATSSWLLGDPVRGLRDARRALVLAEQAPCPRAAAAAHVAVALCSSLAGDLAAVDEHYARAARCAEDAGDVVQAARVAMNRSHHLLADARYAEASRTAARAVRAAAAAGTTTVLGVALCNEGEAGLRLGRTEAAADRYERALALPGTGPALRACALSGLGEVHRRGGRPQQALAAHEEAVRCARRGEDRQVLVPALVALSAVLLADDPERGRALAAEALAGARGSSLVPALLAAARAAAALGDGARAVDLAERALERARRRRERAWLAEALEVRAGLEADPARRAGALREAHAVWEGAGARQDADRVAVALGRLPGAGPEARLRAVRALERLAALGVVEPVDGPRAPGTAGSPDGPRVEVRAFGRFEVLVDGAAVPVTAWQSRRARDLLRLLVARRGRPVPRDEMCEALWPDDDPARTGHRLSVLLSIVRGVLGQAALRGDASCVALDLARVRVDVEEFLDDVAHAVRVRERSGAGAARPLLAAAERRYAEPFEDAPYEDWAVPLREEARGAHLRAVRLLAEAATERGDREDAATQLSRLLVVDPYDEPAHRSLVATLSRAGHHGEARRAHERYATAMASIGIRVPAGPLRSA